MQKVQEEIDKLKNRRALNNKIRHKNNTECAKIHPNEANNFMPHKHLKEIRIPDFMHRESEPNSTIRWSELNFKACNKSWLSKNIIEAKMKKTNYRDSFMPTLAPLPSLMKKLGNQVKGTKHNRE